MIAEFMGKRYDYLICDSCGKIDPELNEPGTKSRITKCCNDWQKGVGKTYSPHGSLSSDLKYDTSWDWLMPVVEKIEDLGFDVWFQTRRTSSIAVSIWKGGDLIIDPYKIQQNLTKIEVVYQAVIAFIQYLNKQ